MTSSSPASDLWHRYGKSRLPDDRRRGSAGRLYWDWYQRTGPGTEILGDVTGLTVLDLGAGNGRQAAHIAECLNPRRVIALDASSSQHERARSTYGHLPRLEFLHSDAASYLTRNPGIDVCYSMFGACDFHHPRHLLPAIARALRPGGTLVIATLAHYHDGSPPETDVRSTTIPLPMTGQDTAALERWVLDTPVWEKLLAEAGFTSIEMDTIRGQGGDHTPSITTALYRARLP